MKYIYHVTVNTGHTRKSFKNEVADWAIDILKDRVKNMNNGTEWGIEADGDYSCRAEIRNNKMAEFIISRLDGFKHNDIIHFVVCRHKRKSHIAWGLLGGVGEPPEVPFCAAKILNENILPCDFVNLPTFADFERVVAWAWLELQAG